MARLVNVSDGPKRVGGWEKGASRTGLPDAPGSLASLPRLLQPGESVDIPVEVLNHPVVVSLGNSADFELRDVQAVPGGEVEDNPAQVKGEIKNLGREFGPSDLSAAALTQQIGLGALPAGAYILDISAESLGAWDGGAMAITIGSVADVDALSGSMDIDVAAGVTVPRIFAGASQSNLFPLGLDVIVEFTSDANLNLNTAGGAILNVLYVVPE